jgi:hypothetical protein
MMMKDSVDLESQQARTFPSANAQDSDGDEWTIKLRTHTKDLNIVVSKFATVEDLLTKTRCTLESTNPSQAFKIRFIFNGKLLQPPHVPLSSFGIQSGSYVHAAISSEDRSQPAAPTTPASEISDDPSEP